MLNFCLSHIFFLPLQKNIFFMDREYIEKIVAEELERCISEGMTRYMNIFRYE